MLLYKYLPLQFAEALALRGEVLFRSLSYFRASEHAARGDEFEGFHVDDPDNDVTIETNSGVRVVGPHRFLHGLDPERTYAFCCSCEFRTSLFDEFESDACVVIRDPQLFFLRCAVAARYLLPLEAPGLIHREVAYFAPNKPSPLDVEDPLNVPFLKHEAFAEQVEYRAVFARRGGFALSRRIVKPAFTFAEEIRTAHRHQRLLHIGTLGELVELRVRGDTVSSRGHR